MTVFVGTAGFSYADWKGPFYATDTRPAAMLEEYAKHFTVVEINSTYYAIPEPGRINAMASRTPPHFQFNHFCPGDTPVNLADSSENNRIRLLSENVQRNAYRFAAEHLAGQPGQRNARRA